jgi:hypothetical protein
VTFFAGPLEKVHFIIMAISCVGIYANMLSTTPLYLNFSDTHIVEEDFTKTISFELKIC